MPGRVVHVSHAVRRPCHRAHVVEACRLDRSPRWRKVSWRKKTKVVCRRRRRQLATAVAVVAFWVEELGLGERKVVVRCRRCRAEILLVGVVLLHHAGVVEVAWRDHQRVERRAIEVVDSAVVIDAGPRVVLPPVVGVVLVVSAWQVEGVVVVVGLLQAEFVWPAGFAWPVAVPPAEVAGAPVSVGTSGLALAGA